MTRRAICMTRCWLALILCTGAALAQAREWSEVNATGFNEDGLAVSVDHPAWFKESFLDLRENLADARRAGKLGIVLFLSTRHCSYCKAFLDITFADPQIRQDLEDAR